MIGVAIGLLAAWAVGLLILARRVARLRHPRLGQPLGPGTLKRLVEARSIERVGGEGGR